MGKRLTALSLTALTALAGCTTYAPRYDSQGRYIGEQEVEDPGRTVATIGVLNGGLLGLALQAMGDHASNEQQRRINEERMYGMQRQIDQRGEYQQAGLEAFNNIPLRQQDDIIEGVIKFSVDHLTSIGNYTPEMMNIAIANVRDSLKTHLELVRSSLRISPRDLFARKFNERYLATFACNSIEDLDKNGSIEVSNIQGDLDGTFFLAEPVTLGYTHFDEAGKKVKLQLRLPSGRTSDREFTARANGQLEYFALPDNLREPGHYTFVAYVNDDYVDHTDFLISKTEALTQVRVFADE